MRISRIRKEVSVFVRQISEVSNASDLDVFVNKADEFKCKFLKKSKDEIDRSLVLTYYDFLIENINAKNQLCCLS